MAELFVCKDIEMKDVGLALKGGAEEIREKIFSNMSSRAAQMLKEDMEFMGPVKMRDVEAAQSSIVTIVRKLEETGEIVLTSGGGDDVLV